MLNIFHLFPIFHKEEKKTYENGVFRFADDILKITLSGTTWCLFVIAILLIASCLSYLYFGRKKRHENLQRMRDIQHLIERTPQKRRPGAVTREREVFRNVLNTAHSYIYPEDENLKCVIRQTRSGTIYGSFMEAKDNKAES
ncbi:uncharacterized protein LOC129912594 [Episyrphus balteatus]|uniref:uncharacterized protein LOC129912594 n=1 Tax=Episyrphus balteatus TaxID=286459 RepID=UPI002485CD23|nr:uncharacterized protein LOC129912594 [Episyrphus balteatus]